LNPLWSAIKAISFFGDAEMRDVILQGLMASRMKLNVKGRIQRLFVAINAGRASILLI
jgi:hypothetical protein